MPVIFLIGLNVTLQIIKRMETDTYPYTKKRSEFGHQTMFEPSDTMFISYLPDLAHDKGRNFSSSEVHVARNPNFRTFSNIPKMSENIVP